MLAILLLTGGWLCAFLAQDIHMFSEVFPRKKTVLGFPFCESCRLFPGKGAATNQSNSWVQIHLMEMIVTAPTVLMISNDPEPYLASCMSPQVPSLLPVKCTPCPSQESRGGVFPFHEI